MSALYKEGGGESAAEHIKSCMQEIRDRGNLNGRENPVNLQLRLQWVYLWSRISNTIWPVLTSRKSCGLSNKQNKNAPEV